jgi:hypothetical protein
MNSSHPTSAGPDSSQPRLRPLLVLAAAALLAPAAPAQNFNLDFGGSFGIPTSAYGAAAGQAGDWNYILAFVPSGPTALVDISGAATGVSVSVAPGPNGYTGGGPVYYNNPNTSGDDQALMDDILDLGAGLTGVLVTFDGLAPRTYDVYTYAWAPDNVNVGAAWMSLVTVPGGTPGQVSVGSIDWPTGGHTLGETYAVHTITVSSGAPLQVLIEADTLAGDWASLNGIQIVESTTGPPATFCTSLPTSLAGCTAVMSGTGQTASKSAGAGSYTLSLGPAPGGPQAGVFFWAKSTIAAPVFKDPSLTQAGGGGFGWRCIVPVRGTPDLPGGTAGVCDGQYQWDFGAYLSGTGSGLISVGDDLYIQGWFRDPGYAAGALFSQGVGPVTVTP